MSYERCTCPRIDGYVLIRESCPHHPEANKRAAAARERVRADNAHEIAASWSDYRKDYGVAEKDLVAAHKAFLAGWKAAREGDQSGVLR